MRQVHVINKSFEVPKDFQSSQVRISLSFNETLSALKFFKELGIRRKRKNFRFFIFCRHDNYNL